MKKWITIHANSKRGSDLAIFISKTVTIMLRHYDQDERESDGPRHWEAIKSVLLRKFARDGGRDFSDEVWLQKIFEGSSKKIIEYCKNKDGILMLFTSYSRTFWWYSNRARMDGLCNKKILRNWKRYIFHRGRSWNFQSIFGKGLIPGGKEKDKARQAVFRTPTNPFGNNPEEEEPHDDRKHLMLPNGNMTKIPYTGIRLSKAKDQGLEFWQTKSFAIMTYATIPGDCIDRVTSQNGGRVNFDRLEAPRPAPKVTLKKNWHGQQQQQHSRRT